MFVTQRPTDKPNRTEKQMLNELAGAQGWLTINMILSSKDSRRQVEVDGILITPEGIITVEAKASPKTSGDLEVSINDDWYIGGEVASFSGKSNPFIQGRQAAQQVHTMLRAEDWRLPRINGSIFVGGNASLPGGPEDLGDVVVATSGQLADALRSKLIDRSLEHNERNRDPYNTPAVTIEEAFLLADALGFPSRNRPTEEQLRAEGFISNAEKRSWLAEHQAKRSRAQEERRAKEESERRQRDAERQRQSDERRRQAEESRRQSEEAFRESQRQERTASADTRPSGSNARPAARPSNSSSSSGRPGWFPKRAIPGLLMAMYLLYADIPASEWRIIFSVAVVASLVHLFLVLPKHVPSYRVRVLLAQPVHLCLGAVPVALADMGLGGEGIFNTLFILAPWVAMLSGTLGHSSARRTE